MGLIYTKVSMTTYVTCALGQFAEEEEEDKEDDGENCSLSFPWSYMFTTVSLCRKPKDYIASISVNIT